MTQRRYSFDDHSEHAEQLDAWAEQWIENAMCTQPADRDRMVPAMAGLYEAAGLTPPTRFAFVASPAVAAIAGGIAAGVWWLRDNPARHVALFGRRLSEAELMAAVPATCALNGSRRLDAATQFAARDAVDAVTDVAALAVDAAHAATDVATRVAASATDVATRVAASTTDVATRVAASATDVAIRDATDAAIRDATDAAIRDATDVATRVAVDVATRVTASTAVFNATDAATSDATYSATDTVVATTSAAIVAVAATNVRLVAFLAACTSGWHHMYCGGSDTSAWPAYLSFFRHVAGLDLPAYDQWQHYENAARYSAARIMHEKFWIVVDRHTEVHVDAQRQLHCETGPARAWGDGMAIWYWHGTRVPRDLIEGDGWTVERILSEDNVEIRRCAIERIGWDRFIAEADLRQLGEPVADPGNPGQYLTLYRLPRQLFDQPVHVLLCTNGTVEADGTRRRFGLTVPVRITNPVEAAAWTYGMTVDEYARAEIRR